jgi:hypothetical protein
VYFGRDFADKTSVMEWRIYMAVLPETFRQKLIILPVSTGLLLHKGRSGLPIFVIVGCTLKHCQIHYRPPRVHKYFPNGKLLEFPLELDNHKSKKTLLSLLINPADSEQWDVLDTLIEAKQVELWECNKLNSTCYAQQLVTWPQIYRDVVRKTQTETRPLMDWPPLLKKWQESEKKSLVAQEVGPSIGMPLSLKPEGKANQEPSLPRLREQEEKKRKLFTKKTLSSYLIPGNWRQKFTRQSTIVFSLAKKREPCILLKVPVGMRIKHAEIGFDAPRQQEDKNLNYPAITLLITLYGDNRADELKKNFYYPIVNESILPHLTTVESAPLLLL